MGKPKEETKKSKYATLFGNTNAQIYKPNDLPIMQQRILEYFELCDNEKKHYTMSGLANYLGISKETLCEYGNKEPFGNLIKRAKQVIEEQLEEMLIDKKTFCLGQIFNLKNNYGWKDQQEIKTTNEVNISPLESAMEKLVESNND